MPEGHTISYLAQVHSAAFGGDALEVSSPQGRFASEARVLSGRKLTDVTARGKHLFLHFDGDVVHIHLGLYGWFTVTGDIDRAPKETVRLRLRSSKFVSDLVGPTKCELITETGMRKVIDRLGVDPIAYDPERDEDLKNSKFAKILASKKTIGELLMDQSLIAGIGNVYRAELLFIVGIHPEVPGRDVAPATLETIWSRARRLLTLGAVDGMIRTVQPAHLLQEEQARFTHSQFSYVYKRTGQLCRICSSVVESNSLGGRTVYWCPSCQPKSGAGQVVYTAG